MEAGGMMVSEPVLKDLEVEKTQATMTATKEVHTNREPGLSSNIVHIYQCHR